MISIYFCESREWENSEAGINGAYAYIYIYLIYIYLYIQEAFSNKEKD